MAGDSKSKKELSDQLNEILGTDYDWTKPLTKEQLLELIEIGTAIKDMTCSDEITIKSLITLGRRAIANEAKKNINSIIDQVMSGKKPIRDLVRRKLDEITSPDEG